MNQTIATEFESPADGDFERLARPCYERVYRFVVRQVNDPTEAQDITQTTFIRAYRSFPKYDSDRPFVPWLFRIARCAVADHFRRRAVLTDSVSEVIPDPSPGTVERIERSENHDALWTLARRLKPRLYQTLYLYYAESFSLAEVAQVMHVARPHAKVLLFRARLALKKLLESEEGKEIGP